MAKRVSYRELFFAHNGPGPWPCIFCFTDVSFDAVVVHHKDHDRSNNFIENLTPAHFACHQSYHNSKRGPGYSRDRVISDEEHDRRSAAAKKNWENADYRERVVSKKRGKRRSPEQCQRSSDAQREVCARPGVREAMSRRARELWKDPEYRARAGRPKGSKDTRPRKKRGN